MTATRLLVIFGLANLSLVQVWAPWVDTHLFLEQDRVFFNWAGILLVGLWGLAYMAAAAHWHLLSGLMLVFAIEKLVFFVRWCMWMMVHGHRLPELVQHDLVTGMFFGGYGIWDGFCALVFFWLFLQGRKQVRNSATLP